MKNAKRFLALVLSFLMVFTSVPVYAANGGGNDNPNSHNLVWGNADSQKINGYWTVESQTLSTKIQQEYSDKDVVEVSYDRKHDKTTITGWNIGTFTLVDKKGKKVNYTVVPDFSIKAGLKVGNKSTFEEFSDDEYSWDYDHSIFSVQNEWHRTKLFDGHFLGYNTPVFTVNNNVKDGYYFITFRNILVSSVYDRYLVKVGDESNMPDVIDPVKPEPTHYYKNIILASDVEGAIKGNASTLDQIDKDAKISNNFEDYKNLFNEKVTTRDAIYTLVDGTVNVATDFEMNTTTNTGIKAVTVTANYSSIDVANFKKVEIITNPEGFNVAKVSLEKEATTKDAQVSLVVTDYVEETYIDENGKEYELVANESKVVAGDFYPNNEQTEYTQTITVNAKYALINKAKVTVNHKLKFVMNGTDELAKEKPFATDETEKMRLESITSDWAKSYAENEENHHEGYDWNGDYNWNPDTKTLTIYYKAKKVTVVKDFGEVEGFGWAQHAKTYTETNYYNYADCAEFNFVEKSGNEFVEKFNLVPENPAKHNNKFYNLDNATVIVDKTQENPTIATVTLKFSEAKYTVTYCDKNGSYLGAEKNIGYGKDANTMIAWSLSQKVKGFKGWVDAQGQPASLKNITENTTVYACLENLIDLHHVLDYYETYTEIENVPNEKTKAFYRENGNYLDYQLGFPYSNASMKEANEKSATIKYWASKYVVTFVDKDGNEVFESQTGYVPYEDHNWDWNQYGYEYAKNYVVPEETKTVKQFGTYTLDKDATCVWFSCEENQGYKTIINIKYVYNVGYQQTSVAVRYWFKNAYGEDIAIDDYYFNMDEKDRTLDNVEAISDKHIPEGYAKDGKLKDSYKGEYKPEKAHQWYRQNLKLVGTPVDKTTTYSVGKYWHLTQVNGKYKRASDWSDKDWYRFNNEAVTLVGKVVSNYGFTEKVVDGNTFNNKTVIWQAECNGYLNGFYDNDQEKDGVVLGNYYLKNENGEYEKYAEAPLTFKTTGDSVAALNGDEFNAYPDEDEDHVLVWKEIKLENNQYNVYGIRTNAILDDDMKESNTITIDFNLPKGLRNVTLEYVLDNLLFGDNKIAEKVVDEVEKIEGKLIEQDEATGEQVVRVDEDDVKDVLTEGTMTENVINGNGVITSNYFKYSVQVNLIERDLTFETVKQNNTNSEIAYKQAIANARQAVRDANENVTFTDNTVCTATGLIDGSIAAGTYDIVVTINNGDETFEVKGQLVATTSKKSTRKPSKTTNITDQLPLAGGAIADLRNNRPNDNITRSEFVGVLAEIFTVLDSGSYKPFEDIAGCKSENEIKKFSGCGIVKGYCDEVFGTNDCLTREQMYLILARAIKFSGKATSLSEEEVTAKLATILGGTEVSEWASEGVAIAIEKGLVDEENVDPQGFITRALTADKLEKFIAVITTTEEEVK